MRDCLLLVSVTYGIEGGEAEIKRDGGGDVGALHGQVKFDLRDLRRDVDLGSTQFKVLRILLVLQTYDKLDKVRDGLRELDEHLQGLSDALRAEVSDRDRRRHGRQLLLLDDVEDDGQNREVELIPGGLRDREFDAVGAW